MAEQRPQDDPLPHDHRRAQRPKAGSPLRRSRDRRLGGVAGGIARFVGVGPGLVRWIFGLSLPLTIGLSGLAYLVLWMLLPGSEPGPDPGPDPESSGR